MKTSCFLLLTIGLAAVMLAKADAAAASPVSQQGSQDIGKAASNHPGDTSQGSPPDDGKDPDERQGPRHAMEKSLSRSHASFTKTKRPTLVRSNRAGFGSATAINVHQPGSGRSGGVEGKGFIQNETPKGIASVRPPSAVRPTAATLGNVRHRSPNPAIVSGSVNSRTGSVGVISGTRMERRH